MKKCLLMFLLMFLTLMKVNALDIESNLSELNSKFSELETRMESYENSRLDKTYPIGSIIETTSLSSTSEVSEALGGTWETYGVGRIMVGINTSDTNFNTAGKTGGVSSITLVTANLPSHTHSIPALSGTAASAGAHTHNVSAYFDQSGYGTTIPAGTVYFMQTGWLWTSTAISDMNRMNGVRTDSKGNHTHSVTTTASTSGSTGRGTSFTNMQPSIAVYRYKRIS